MKSAVVVGGRVVVVTVAVALGYGRSNVGRVGKGIYTEPVEHKDQTLDDAEVFYAIVGNLKPID